MADENNTSTSDESRFAPNLVYKRRKADQFSRHLDDEITTPEHSWTPQLGEWFRGWLRPQALRLPSSADGAGAASHVPFDRRYQTFFAEENGCPPAGMGE